MDERNGPSRRAERLQLLETLAARLDLAGVPCAVRRHTPAVAPSCPDEGTVPALDIGCWARVRVLYWRTLAPESRSEPWFVVWDSHTRWATDEPGIDRLASVLALMWLDRRARGDVDRQG